MMALLPRSFVDEERIVETSDHDVADAATLTASASVLIGGSVVTTGRLVAQASAGADAAVASR